MKHHEGFFKNVRDAKIYHQCWLPAGELKAILLIAHGLAEHGGRYMNLVNYFVPLGYGVYSLDHLGHGKSAGRRVYVERFEDFTDTLQIYLGVVRAAQPDKPIFLIGHSMGGLIGALYLLDHQSEFVGSILSGPGVKVRDNISSAIIFAGKILSAVVPKARLIRLDAEGVSRDPAVVQAYIKDPLVHSGKVTARLGAEMLKSMQSVTADAHKITLPILILQGTADRLVDPAGAQMFYDTVGSLDKTIKVYDGLFHEVFNEPEHAEVLNDVATWIEAHLGDR